MVIFNSYVKLPEGTIFSDQSMNENETSPKTLGPCQCVKEFVHSLALALWTPRQFFGSIQRVCCVQQKVWKGFKRLGKLANKKQTKAKTNKSNIDKKQLDNQQKWKTMETHTHNGSGTRDVAIQVLVNCLNRACAPNTHQTPTHADTDMRQKLNILRPSMTLRPSNLLITSLQYSTPFFYYLRTDKCQSSSWRLGFHWFQVTLINQSEKMTFQN